MVWEHNSNNEYKENWMAEMGTENRFWPCFATGRYMYLNTYSRWIFTKITDYRLMDISPKNRENLTQE